MKSNSNKIQAIIDEFKVSKTKRSHATQGNVIDLFARGADLYPKDVERIIHEGADSVILHLEEAQKAIQATRKKIVDKAREYLSEREHFALYGDLNSMLADPNNPEWADKIKGYDWAEATLSFIELQDLVEED